MYPSNTHTDRKITYQDNLPEFKRGRIKLFPFDSMEIAKFIGTS